MKRSLFVVCVLGLLLGADDPSDAAKKELDKLQGEWTAESVVRDGQEVPADQVKALKRLIKGGDYTIELNGQAVVKGSFKLDPAKKPKTIDITRDEDKDNPVLGIYELEGDTYKICYGGPGKPRPTEFGSKEGSGITYAVWKRVKK